MGEDFERILSMSQSDLRNDIRTRLERDSDIFVKMDDIHKSGYLDKIMEEINRGENGALRHGLILYGSQIGREFIKKDYID